MLAPQGLKCYFNAERAFRAPALRIPIPFSPARTREESPVSESENESGDAVAKKVRKPRLSKTAKPAADAPAEVVVHVDPDPPRMAGSFGRARFQARWSAEPDPSPEARPGRSR